MQRGGLARAGRAHAQHHAVGPLDRVAQALEVGRRQAQPVQGQRARRGQDAHHHVFEPVVGGYRGHAQFDAMLRREAREVDLPVLRLAPFADVQLGHDLDARDHRVAVVGRQLQVGAQDAVLAEADADLLAPGVALDVDVGHALGMRFDHHAVDHAYQRVVGLLDLRVLGPLAFLLAFLLQRLQQRAGVARVEIDRRQRRAAAALSRRTDLVVGLVQHAVEVAALAQHRRELHLRAELDLVQRRAPVRRVVERHHQAALDDGQRHDLQALRRRVAQLAQRLGLGFVALEVHQRVAHLARQRRLQVGARHRAAAHQHLAQGQPTLLALLHERVLEFLRVDHAERLQCLADAHDGHARLELQRLHQGLAREHRLRQARRVDRAGAGRIEWGVVEPHVDGERLVGLGGQWFPIDVVVGHARDEGAVHRARTAHGRKEEQAVGRLHLAHRAAVQHGGLAQPHPDLGGAGHEPLAFGRDESGRRQRLDPLDQRERTELVEAQGERAASALQLHVDRRRRRIEGTDAAFDAGAVEADDLARPRLVERACWRIQPAGWSRPYEGRGRWRGGRCGGGLEGPLGRRRSRHGKKMAGRTRSTGARGAQDSPGLGTVSTAAHYGHRSSPQLQDNNAMRPMPRAGSARNGYESANRPATGGRLPTLAALPLFFHRPSLPWNF